MQKDDAFQAAITFFANSITVQNKRQVYLYVGSMVSQVIVVVIYASDNM